MDKWPIDLQEDDTLKDDINDRSIIKQ